jgi:hypothetical protein
MRCSVLLYVLAGVLSLPAPAHAQEAGAAMTEIQSLNTEAQTAFENYSYKKALTKLEKALTLAIRGGLTRDARMADVHVMLGVAAIAGANDLYRGLHSFVQALRLNPKVEIPKKLATPQLAQMFATARKTAKEIGTPPTIRLPQTKSGAGEGKVARSQATGLVHSPIDTARRGFPVPVKVETGLDIQAHKVYLFYRPPGTVAFLALPMVKTGNVFRVAVPPEATTGRYFHYYIEARDQRGRLAASFGSARSPTVVTIQ